MKSFKDIFVDTMRMDTDMIKMIDVPNYYGFSDMLDSFISAGKEVLNSNLSPDMVSVVCVTYDAVKIALEKGFKTYYLYDLLDFTDKGYYFYKKMNDTNLFIFESIDNVDTDILLDIRNAVPLNSNIFLFTDSFIPRRYFGDKDMEFLQTYNPHRYKIDCNKTTKVNTLVVFLNKLRQRKVVLKDILESYEGRENTLIHPKPITKFDLSELDLSKPIFTPHITLLKDMNIKIRRYLNLEDINDPYMPNVNEFIVSHGPSTAYLKESGTEVNLPVGYRIKVESVVANSTEGSSSYKIDFTYTSPVGKEEKAYVVISKSYLQYMCDGETHLKHNPNSYNYFYGYVLSGIHSLNDKYDDIQIVYDYLFSFERRDLYTCACAAKNNIYIFYCLEGGPIEIKE